MTAARTVVDIVYAILSNRELNPLSMALQTIVTAAAALRSGATSSADLIDESLAAFDRHNARTNAFIRVDADEARAAARTADSERARGLDRGPLHGVPLSLKDLIDVARRWWRGCVPQERS
jgi:Asp-tRNA(Asn)/Glu-tRNA(Gln) amidotransferase A subunit family amidase